MKIPLIINNRNRLSFLRDVVTWFLECNHVTITILDNDSSYSPLESYYQKIKNDVKIIYLQENMGHTALYQSGILNQTDRYFMYSDPDILPIETCPKDLPLYLLDCKKKYAEYNKVGVSLKIDDLPNHYTFKDQVISWESKFWQNKTEDLYVADVDTTLAMYDKSNLAGTQHTFENCLRTNIPYIARHLPWYLDLSNLSAEEKYYNKNSDASFVNIRGEQVKVGVWTQLHKKNGLKHL